MMDGVPSKVTVLLVESVQSWVSVLFMDGVQSWVSVLFMDGVQSWVSVHFMDGVQSCVTGTKIARGEGGTKVISISLYQYLVSSLVPQEILVTAPKLQEDGSGTNTGNIY